MIRAKSIEKKPSPDDGERIYVDSLWANGAFTEVVKISEWKKEIAPSYDLWRFHYHPDKWDDYVQKYKEQLQDPAKQKALRELLQKSQKGNLTLVYGNGDEHHNNALVLLEILEEMANQKNGG